MFHFRHKWLPWQSAKKENCTIRTTRECMYCEKVESTSELSHSFAAWRLVTAPRSNNAQVMYDGYQKYITQTRQCSDCGYTQMERIYL